MQCPEFEITSNNIYILKIDVFYLYLADLYTNKVC